ncbi:MAG: hypothetical protein KGQ70_04080 [Alphaproteobacteria bacterium]|nr:hypothetical protein [Alphaproteobacteria bacterium]
MTPEEKEKFAKAYRTWMDKNPNADIPISDATLNGQVLTLRTLMETELSTGALFQEVDRFLAQNRNVTLDQIIEMNFGPQPKEQPPAPESARPKNPSVRPSRHWKI